MIALLLLVAAAETPAEILAEPVVITATRTLGTPATSPLEVRTIEGAALRAAKAPDEALRSMPEFTALVGRQPGLDLLGQPRFVRVGIAYHAR